MQRKNYAVLFRLGQASDEASTGNYSKKNGDSVTINDNKECKWDALWLFGRGWVLFRLG
jgi:hypothetical protein